MSSSTNEQTVKVSSTTLFLACMLLQRRLPLLCCNVGQHTFLDALQCISNNHAGHSLMTKKSIVYIFCLPYALSWPPAIWVKPCASPHTFSAHVAWMVSGYILFRVTSLQKQVALALGFVLVIIRRNKILMHLTISVICSTQSSTLNEGNHWESWCFWTFFKEINTAL